MTTPSSDALENETGDFSGLRSSFIDEGYVPSPKEPVDAAKLQELRNRIQGYQRMFLLITVTSAALTYSSLPLVNYVKNVLKASPSQLIFFTTTTRLGTFLKPVIGHIEDTYAICGFKIKSYTLIYAIGSSLMCISIVFDHSHLYLLCAQVSLLTIFDCVGAALAEGMTAITLKYQQRLVELDPSLEKSNESANFGYVQVLGNAVRMISVFVGGYYGTEINFTAVYTTMSTFPALMVVYSLFCFEEDTEFYKQQKGDEGSQQMSLLEKLSTIKNILLDESMRNPMSIMLLTVLIPNYGDFFIFILTDPHMGKWSFKNLAVSQLIIGIFYAVLMVLLLSQLSKFSFQKLYLFGTSGFLISAVSSVALPYADKLSFGLLFTILVVSSVIGAVGADAVVIPTVGRFSSKCPKGLENLGISTFGTILILVGSISGYVSSPIISAFDVKEGSFHNIVIPLVITIVLRCVVVLLTPFFIKS